MPGKDCNRPLVALIALASLGVLCAAGAAATAPTSADLIPAVSAKDLPEWYCAGEAPKFVKWRAPTGSKTASPVVSGDRILVGTNNEEEAKNVLPDHDLGVIKCFRASDGKFLWKTTHERRGGRKHDVPRMPIMSQPAVDGERAYYVSNRGELVCVAISNGNVLWKLDMVADLGIYKVEAPDLGNPTSNPLVVDDLVYCVTGNGGDFSGVPAPTAPSFVAVNKMTGKLAWSSNAPGKSIVYGQWSSPALATVADHKEILFPGGDGYLYGFYPPSGKMLWKIDLGGVVPAAEAELRGLGRRNFFVASPTVDREVVYVGLDQIPEDNLLKTRRPVYAVELARRGGLTVPRIKWTFDHADFDGTTGGAAVADGKLYVISRSGVLFALDAGTGRPIWMCSLDEQAALFASPRVRGDRLYVASDLNLFMFALGPAPRCMGSFNLGGSLDFTAPVTADGNLYIGAGGYLWSLFPPSH